VREKVVLESKVTTIEGRRKSGKNNWVAFKAYLIL
jgi:hypothetical protein